MTLSEELAYRGFINQTTLSSPKELDKKTQNFYWGVDPSAPSMTIGNLAAAMMAKTFIKHGYKPILLVGGATGLIGDPDGKTQERDLKKPEEIAKNKVAIVEQYKQIFRGDHFKVVDNYDWFSKLGYLDFLRTVGKHVPMRAMVNREFVKERLSAQGSGISYAEFSYSLIQGYDFLHLFQHYGVTLQLSGADQWGNSIAGVDLIRRILGKAAHVWTAPLVVNKTTGVKFGKTEDGAVWLDSDLTSVYQFYQFWLNVEDDRVGEFLKIYTELSREKIGEVMAQFEKDKGGRLAQKTLAREVTELIHGKDETASVMRVTEALFDGRDYTSLSAKDFSKLTDELPATQVLVSADLIAPLVDSGLAKSNSEARRFLEQGAIYLNGKQVNADKTIEEGDFIDGKHAVLRRGKNKSAIIKRSK